MRHVESFVAAVTHEMKTPLAGIKSLLQTMAAGRVPREQVQQLLALGLKESERLEHTIENVLLAGKLRGGRLQVLAESVGLKGFLESFVEHRRRYLPDRPEAIELRWPDGVGELSVRADPQALRTILENLVDNAFKYGGQPPEVAIEVTPEARSVAVSVVDNGIGFEPDQAQMLFVPYRRALGAGSRSSLKHGTGLGLSISLELARRMGGRLTAESDGPGHGSRFTLVVERDS
ncbi:MAG: sensor histidine kinase [Deltaproteobacteria bacterium]|nr:MAG: sensor histidine kinase [Deltaproteobacteria bacterium]